ncbi:MAG TPA: hypothetical protein VFV98_03470 [Vicinamibacterales bacterium]|nr:hypothetical protein [Vicinamibacterales bacterium]
MKRQYLVFSIVALGLMATLSAGQDAAQAPPSPDQVVAALKQNLAESAKKIRTYEWIETTSISLKGEEKARKQNRVFYGADGKLTKVPMGAPAAAPAPDSGGRGGRSGRLKEKVVENKKDEMSDYMEKAVALIHQYVPPNAEKIQAAKDGGKMKVLPPQAGKVRVEFKDFILPGDLMNIDVDGKALLLAGVNIATYIEKKDDAVTLDVVFGKLTDGTGYNAKTTLAAKAKNITVVIENSGHRPLGK